MKRLIRVNEQQLKRIISESVVRVLNEQELKPGTKFSVGKNNATILAKMIAKQYGIDVNTLRFDGVNLVYEPKTKQRKKISKPDNISVYEYYRKYVLPNNPKMAQEAERYEDEDWRPVQNIGRYFKGAADFSDLYEVSNYGRLRVINFSDAEKSRIYNGYEAPTRNAMQFHLNTSTESGESMKTCPDVKYIVADAWLEPKDPSKYKVVHKDGDWHNNKVENLMWVPRSEKKDKV